MAKGLSRRSFVCGSSILAGAAMTAALTGCSPSTEESSSSEDAQESVEIVPSETVDVDVIVAGSGTAGCVAALEAVANGAKKVTVIEKLSFLGGSSTLASGILGINSKAQTEAGIHYDEETLINAAANWHKLNFDRIMFSDFIYKSGANIDYLIDDLGINLSVAPMPEEVATVTPENSVMTAPVGGQLQEGDFYVGVCCSYPKVDGVHGGQVVSDRFKELLAEQGIEVMYETGAVKLVKEEDAVTGLIAQKKDGDYIQFNAPSVVIATGSFGHNFELCEKLTSRHADRLEFGGLSDSTGDGYTMTQEIGAYSSGVYTLDVMTARVYGTGLTDPVNIFGARGLQNVWVNGTGHRFVCESSIFPALGNAVLMMQRPFAISDQKYLDTCVNEGCMSGFADVVETGTKFPDLQEQVDAAIEANPDYLCKADTLEELAEMMQIDSVQFVKTIEEYNAHCEAGIDPLGKAADFLIPLDTPPYYGMFLNGNCINTSGGIRTDYEMRVIDKQEKPIKGLYAAGLDVEGFEGYTYDLALPTTRQGLAVYTGRIAGANAGKQL